MINKLQFKRLPLEFISGFLIIFSCFWLGKFISPFLGSMIPASIIGMLLLTLLLQIGIVRLAWVDKSASLFIRWMSLLFVPIGVGLVEQLDTLASALPAMLVTCVIGTLVLLALVGRFYQFWEKKV